MFLSGAGGGQQEARARGRAGVANNVRPSLLDPVEQLHELDVQRARESDDRRKPWFTSGSFQQRNLGAVEVARIAKSLL